MWSVSLISKEKITAKIRPVFECYSKDFYLIQDPYILISLQQYNAQLTIFICLLLIVREIDNKSHITKVKKRYLMDISSMKSFVSNVHNIQLYIPVKENRKILFIK